MIAYLRGTVKFLDKDFCILDVNGVGYKVFLDDSLQLDTPAELFIHTSVREDAINLFGFKERTTLEFFELLLNVSGIGAKTALSIVSKISVNDFAALVAAQDIKALARLPNIGKKSAERICLELKDKIFVNSQPAQIQSFAQEASEALEALGYTASEISQAFKEAPPNSSTEQLIKFALKNLGR